MCTRLYAKGANSIPLTQTGALWDLLKIAIDKACAQHPASGFCDSSPDIIATKLFEGWKRNLLFAAAVAAASVSSGKTIISSGGTRSI